MKKLEVRCPSCSSRGYIEISEEEVEKAARGVFAVNVSEGIACEHSFVAYIDKNLTIRDTFIADFQLELPEMSIPQKVEKETSSQLESVDVSLIKLNLTASLIINAIRAILFKKRVLIITDQEFMVNQIRIFFNYITENTFKTSILVILENKTQPGNLQDYVVLKDFHVIQDKDDILNQKKINIEKTLVRKFLEEYELIASIHYLRDGIQESFRFAEFIIEMVKNLKKKEKLVSSNVIEEFKKKLGVKIQQPYLDFLYEIVENYFEVKVPKSSEVSNFLSSL
ncbi:MAG: hypothetical protein KGD67_04305 [Candidatus Lokiarchaeota archaeon]|nr:hypothetical protein [Candidatus Lokiarchaeota archaeon]